MRLTQGVWVPSTPDPNATLINVGWVDAEDRWIYVLVADNAVQSAIYSYDPDGRWAILLANTEVLPESERTADSEWVEPFGH